MKKILVFIGVGVLALGIALAAVFAIPAMSGSAVIAERGVRNQRLAEIPEIVMNPEQNEKIGTLYMPKFDVEVPLIYGYNAEYMDQYFDEVGLEAWNNFPGQNNKLYINGHRHLAFQNLKNIEIGDTIILKMPYGEFTYEVYKEPQVVLANDSEAVKFYTEDHDTEFKPQILRLQTCYPFEAGSTLDHRYLVDLKLVESKYVYQ
ncbi:sortase [Culicoidibacter larvae]|uniref:Sortase n=1 Tax=Culicoidibacter larvae TaxID=2579976 RepID=A0A5R8QG19_9FIRM|nr:sortase [Culicoidibacter larvae]TLG75423.1 sortase [Culicoidibacter larvae]